MNPTIYVLIDTDNDEVRGYTLENDLEKAVTEVLKKDGDWDTTSYYSDGIVELSGEEYVKTGRYRGDWALKKANLI